MTDLSVRYRITERGFTYAQFSDRCGKIVLEVQCSSAADQTGLPAGALRGGDGDPEPGTSALWLYVARPGNPDAERVGVSLNRRAVAALAGILTRWLATGFVEGDDGTR